MSESILNALMHLFAIIATIREEGVTEHGRRIIKSYLLQFLKEEIALEYLSLFDDFLDFYKRDKEYQISGEIPDTSVYDSQYLAKVCNQIKKDLHKNDRIIVLLRLIELAVEDKNLADHEREFIVLVAETFDISKNELDNALVFVGGGRIGELNPENILIIGPAEESTLEELEGDWIDKNRPEITSHFRKIPRNDLDGEVLILHFSSIDLFVFKYSGIDLLSLEGHPVITDKFYIFEPGSILRGEKIVPIYYNDIASHFLRSESDIKIILTAENIEFRFRNSTAGIHKFTFSEESGQLIGIMGGSGVGKSTLLNLLSGQLVPLGGKVTINDYNVNQDRFKLKNVIGFVPQEDLLFEELTVFQNLYYNARLCFGDFSKERILGIVNKTLTDLDIMDIKDLKVGNPVNKFISGGERKRLNIGLELMREPSVLFVDEPTSGLSSTDSWNIIRLLKEQAIKGKLVIVNIHQPSSDVFKMLDKLWILDKGGYPVYAGNPIDGIIYFKKLSKFADSSESECPSCGNINPEQVLDIIEARKIDEQGRYSQERKIKPEEWYDKYKNEIEPGIEIKPVKKILPRNLFKIPDIDKQFFIFFKRNLLTKLSNTQYILINLLEVPLLAIILSYFIKYAEGNVYIFSENKNVPTYLFMAVIVALFVGMVVSAEEIIKDRKILKRESFLNLSRFSYLNSKILYLFGLSALQTLILVVIGNMILEIKGMTFVFWLTLFSTACFANLVGLNISASLNSVVSIYILIPLILIPQILLSGVPVRFDDLNKSLTNRIYVPMIGDVMTSRWAYEALAVELFKDNLFEKNFYVYDQALSESNYRTSFLIPRLLNVAEECQRSYENNSNKEVLNNNLLLLQNEIRVLGTMPGLFPFEYIDNLKENELDNDIVSETLDYLTYARLHFQESSKIASSQRDSLYRAMADKSGEQAVYKLRQDNHNEKLTDYVTNRLEVSKIVEINHRLYQKRDPIFIIPEHNAGRAHFYAPFKKFNNQLYDTKWFNLIVIWLFTFFLYIFLLLDVFRKLNEYLTTFRIRR
jgi:ABC-type multidrug transport system ATPase subunit